MHSFANVEAFASEELWAWVSACKEMDLAIGELEMARAALTPLIDDADWQSDGVRALHELLRQFQERTAGEIGDLRARQAELETAEIA
ncbi:hypothetical protein [Microbacterium sp. PMB16]|uniref:hypothetical protein n=1 Tax=Microbacterium sp. PMB16 TaxID=3120157 RepID=UPI003F4BCB77